LNMHTNLPMPECHKLRSPYRLAGGRYINAQGLPLYYRAVVYKLPK